MRLLLPIPHTLRCDQITIIVNCTPHLLRTDPDPGEEFDGLWQTVAWRRGGETQAQANAHQCCQVSLGLKVAIFEVNCQNSENCQEIYQKLSKNLPDSTGRPKFKIAGGGQISPLLTKSGNTDAHGLLSICHKGNSTLDLLTEMQDNTWARFGKSHVQWGVNHAT